MGNDVDPLGEECGISFNRVRGEVTETRVFAATDARVRPVDKFNLRAANLREALDIVEREGFVQVLSEDADRFSASGYQVWRLVFDWGNKQVPWSLVKKAQLSCKTKMREGENISLPCLSGKIATNIEFPSPVQHLSKHPLRKGMRESARVRRACKDPRVYLRTGLYKKKGSVEDPPSVSGVETATKVCSSEGERQENMEEKSGGDSEGNNGDDKRAPKGAGRNKTTKKMKKKSPLTKEEPVGRIIISTLDRSAQV